MKKYRFTFGPWNISTGADPFGPPVRREVEFAQKIREYKKVIRRTASPRGGRDAKAQESLLNAAS